MLASLNGLLRKGKRWLWDSKRQRAFNNMKCVVVKYTLLRYPILDEPFEIQIDASLHQIGAVIVQNYKPIACWAT